MNSTPSFRPTVSCSTECLGPRSAGARAALVALAKRWTRPEPRALAPTFLNED